MSKTTKKTKRISSVISSIIDNRSFKTFGMTSEVFQIHIVGRILPYFDEQCMESERPPGKKTRLQKFLQGNILNQ